MPTFIDTLKLRLLLAASMPLMRRAEARSERFRAMLHEESFVLQIRTRDGAGGYYELRDGTLRLRGGIHARPDLTQHWERSRDAVKVMLSRDETDMLRAVEAGQCRMQGRFAVALWFNEAMKIARPH
ncbi:hypothetical protein TUM18999_28420 [Pseudomonas tohonis]|uniref:SCP-2 sterol transfer family protein n=1 Tax=Pseudomonas tohonis TaxID=2725477 RepID=A0A6J4E816_9PSED|nr:hypothetical protein [Pseudomonas tohonis]BCG24651.1 hypothetical protein TUM18999_28420 [Pseudomonas tohonis]GJN51990.1 hypothetical protein TUM20286_17420 [Pseudomonas tohonis]